MTDVRVLQGHEGPIEFNDTDRSVTKTYVQAERAGALRMALRESERAARFQSALAGQRGIRCPRVLACEPGPPPSVRFELCSGEDVQTLLLKSRVPAGCMARLAESIGRGLRIYVRLFSEPYYDLHFKNMLYDAAAGELTFLDFALPERLRDARFGTPLEASLANLVGCACYELARPSALLAPRSGALALVNAVLAGFAGEISLAQVRHGARRVFRQLCVPGRGLRQSYYGSLGELIGVRCLKSIAAR